MNESETLDLDILIQKTKEALEEAQAQATEAFRQGRYADVQKAAEKVAQLAAALKHLEGLRGQWDALADILAGVNLGQGAAPRRGRRKGKPRQPLPKGLKTPQGAYCIPILKALEELGGRGRASEVLNRVGELMRGVLKEIDYVVVPSGSVRWRNTAEWCRFDMVRQGLLASDSPRGIWEITEKGRQYLREHGG